MEVALMVPLAHLAVMMAVELPVLLAGVFPLDADMSDRWALAGAWQLPVGSPVRLGDPATADEPAFQLNRGLEWTRGRATHQGADLANGRSGDTVRAAASGLVTLATDGDNGNGYGGHVVIAHRMADERVVYTVYAHLERGSIVL
jgi:murein DD-endopeptidase MepM/ murein hydrolase activator NlpD